MSGGAEDLYDTDLSAWASAQASRQSCPLGVEQVSDPFFFPGPVHD